ncbi:VWA domain-containing protein [bacterium]|nr:VWA domain-containing protein [bacterium]
MDIVIAMDVSGSMLAEDFKPDNRMTAAKKVASRFIESRPNDRIGMVVFGANALTQCPITSDRPVLLELIDRIEVGMAGSGTAVGMGIATAANRLKTSNAKSKVIVLVTDGVNNAGEITPEEAARIASSLKIKVYSVGIGKEGGAPIPVIDPVLGKTYEKNPDGTVALTELDEPLLKMIAETTGGRYFRATNERVLADIYETINRLEKTPTKITYYNRYTDWFGAILWVALGMLFVEIVVTRLWLRVAP